MRIAVIGAGNVGGAIARAASAAGLSVVVTAIDPEHAQAVADSVGGQVAPSSAAAVSGPSSLKHNTYRVRSCSITDP